MIESGNLEMVNWARAQFALTAMYHWVFVPLTLGLSFLCAFFETIYIKTNNEEWRRLSMFWMRLFGINFAIGVATGIIMEFEFGTNWSNYSWMVGDIFGAPLAVEGILAFFLEATFFAVMFFGWNRVSKGFHLFSTWMVAIGSNLSALWILVANGWMQYPTGMTFNPETARFEMQNFWDVLFSPAAISKFTHTTSSSFVVGSLFVIAISSWFLLKGSHRLMARRSIVVASVFGLLSSLYVGLTGDEAAYTVAKHQPVKLAAFEGLWDGARGADIVAAGIPNIEKQPGDNRDPFLFEIKIPGLLSLLANRDADSFVPGINDLVYGNSEENIEGAVSMIEKGRQARSYLDKYKNARKSGDEHTASSSLEEFKKYESFLGYGFLDKPESIVPPVNITFYAFHVMVIFGTAFILLFALFLKTAISNTLERKKWLLYTGSFSFAAGLVASQSGWIVAEVGRQPWAIQGLLPVNVATSNIGTGAVMTTFFMFLVTFTLLLIAEIGIMMKQIKIGPEE